MPRLSRRAALLAGLTMLAAAPAAAQATEGAAVFQRSCANSHTGAADSRAPAREALRPFATGGVGGGTAGAGVRRRLRRSRLP